jgi:SAM-dependent methyltransferase
VRFYDEIGAAQLEERYMAINAYAVARLHLVLEQLLPVARAGGKLLDIGCASGYYAVSFAKAGGYARGLDISAASIALAQRRAEREGVAEGCDFMQGDMRSLPIRESEYDAVGMIEVLEHIREQKEAVEQAVRALRPGGVLVLATPHAFDNLPRWQRFRHRNAPTPETAGVDVRRVDTNPFVTESGIEHEPYFHDAFTFEQIRALLPHEAEIVRLHSLYMPVPGLRLLARLPPRLRRTIRRLIGEEAAPAATEEQPREGAHGSEPLPIPPLNKEAALMVGLSKLMWRVPAIMMTYNQVLLVARRRDPTNRTAPEPTRT